MIFLLEQCMKRLVTNSTIPTLNIVVDLNINEMRVAASEELLPDSDVKFEFIPMRHPNIKRKKQQSDEWLRHVNDLVISILGSMQGRKFKILEKYPSKKSYTYYIRFQPTDKAGNLWDTELQLQIELRDHVSDTHEDFGNVAKQLFVRTYYLENKSYHDMYGILREIWKILDDLQMGNFSSFGT